MLLPPGRLRRAHSAYSRGGASYASAGLVVSGTAVGLPAGAIVAALGIGLGVTSTYFLWRMDHVTWSSQRVCFSALNGTILTAGAMSTQVLLGFAAVLFIALIAIVGIFLRARREKDQVKAPLWVGVMAAVGALALILMAVLIVVLFPID